MGAMDMAGDPATAGSVAQGVNCEFCGTPVLGGTKLCTACRSALKRARNEPSSVLSPLMRRASDTIERRRARKAAKAGTDGKAAAVIPPPVARRRSATPALVGVVLAAVCITGYAILQVSEHAVPLPEPASDTATTAQPAGDAMPAATPPAAAEPAPMAPIVLPAEVEVEPLPHPAAKPHASARKPVIAPETVPARIAAPAAILQPVAPPVAPAAPQPADRRTQLRERFAQCTMSDVLEKAFCEQRARVDLCDGLWGSVPQCPPQRDYGN
jgi:hypothetical protein